MAKKKVLVVEDDPDISELVRQNIKKEGWEAIEAADGREALRLIKKSPPDMIILDLMLPGVDGKQVCRAVKGDEDIKSIPIIMVTAKGDEVDRIVGLELGADDYLAKPFSPRELILRIKAIFKRTEANAKVSVSLFKWKHLEVQCEKRSVRYKGKKVDLTKVEFNLLAALLRRPGIVFSRDELMDIALGIDAHLETRTVDMHISRLREKLGNFGTYIETVRGIGYRLSDEVSRNR